MTRLVARERCPSWALSGLSSLRSLCRRPAYVRGSRTWLGLAWCGTPLALLVYRSTHFSMRGGRGCTVALGQARNTAKGASMATNSFVSCQA
jgi:hypothetical protein